MHRRTVAAVAALFAILGGLTPAAAAKPSSNIVNRDTGPDDDIQRTIERVETLSNQASEVRKSLNKAQMKLAATYEKVTSAQQKAHAAKSAAESARERADKTHKQAETAVSRVHKARKEVDELVAESLRLGSLDSARALLGADDLGDALARASLLKVISESHSDSLRDLRHASTRKTEKDSAAEEALRQSVEKRKAAQRAVKSAKQAYEEARSGENAAQQRAEKLVEKQQTVRSRLRQARQKLAALRDHEGPGQSPGSSSESEQSALSGTAQATGGDAVAPTDGTVTSTYGPRGGTIHYGVDIANNIGTPVVSVLDGTVIAAGPASGFGQWVRVRHDNDTVTVYGHIHESLVSEGEHVSAGEQIATIGNRGESTGPHLHFGVQRSGSKINPLPWLHSHGVSLR